MLWRLVNIAIVGVVVLLLAAASGWYLLQQWLDEPLAVAEPGIEYQLQRGETLYSLAAGLAQEGVLDKPRWLSVYCRLSGRGHAIKAGDYWLEPGISARQLLDKLERGDVRVFQVTLVEGWTLRQVYAHLQQQPRLAKVLSEPLTAGQLGLDWQGSLEGMLFPDTYRYHAGDSDMSILVQAWQRMQQVLAEEWQQRSEQLPYDTPYEALIMASLVERETGYAPERPIIAGVFVRRLQKNMRLQTDPTVIYGLGEAFDGNLRSRHLKDDSNSYNTYRHHGLPPTPIALAGREAIHAALHPAAGSALYFVARGDGSHYFSDTLEEHQRAVRKYQIEQRRKNYSSSPPPGAFLPSSSSGESRSI